MDHLENTYSSDEMAWAMAMEVPTGVITCSLCKKPAAIFHDLDMSVCCLAQIFRSTAHAKH